jgi:hypothetical protein
VKYFFVLTKVNIDRFLIRREEASTSNLAWIRFFVAVRLAGGAPSKSPSPVSLTATERSISNPLTPKASPAAQRFFRFLFDSVGDHGSTLSISYIANRDVCSVIYFDRFR